MELVIPDVLHQLFSRLDDRDLLALITSSPALNSILAAHDQQAAFWYTRAKLLVSEDLQERPLANWKRIYLDLLAHIAKKPDRTIAYLESVKVIEEVYSIRWTIRSVVASIEVVEYLIANNISSTDLDYLIESNIQRDNRQLLAVIEYLENETEHAEYIRSTAVGYAIELDRMELLLALVVDRGTLLVARGRLDSAVKSDSEQMLSFIISQQSNASSVAYKMCETACIYVKPISLEFLLNKYDGRKIVERQLTYPSLGDTMMHDYSVPIWRVLLRYGLRVYPAQWRSVLKVAIEEDRPVLLKFMLEYTNPDTKTNQALSWAIASGNARSLEILLADPRVDPTKNLSKLVDSQRHLVKQLLASAQIDVDVHLDSAALTSIWKRWYQPVITIEELLQPSSMYWRLVRFMTIKMPNASLVLDYLIGYLSDKHVTEAITSVLYKDSKYSTDSAAFRALVIYLLYPTLSLEESEMYLRADGYTDLELDKSNVLIKLLKR
ncbi:Hypothetical protein POVR2_LOCUS62 [uncultured virus]|nr:Hypothetical protein POVR2_LOCUS62 [uncultured virus]